MPGPVVLHEDNHVIAVFKPHGLLTQGDVTGDPSLLEQVRAYLKAKYRKPGNVFVGLVHRLDRPAAGVVVFGRTSKGASRLSEQFRERTPEKIYWARVEGEPPGAGALHHHHRMGESRAEISERAGPDTKPASLEFRRIGPGLLEVRLLTGRKHQIRAQLAFAGHPVLGDRKYGAKSPFRAGAIALLAKRLTFRHPTLGTTITVETPEGLG